MEGLCPLQDSRMERTIWKQRWTSERRTEKEDGRSNPNWQPGFWRKDESQQWLGSQPRKRQGNSTENSGKKRQTRGKRGGRKKKKESVLGKGIYNLSSSAFTDEELKVMDLGLKFAPDKRLNKFEAYIDHQKFMRKLNLKKILP